MPKLSVLNFETALVIADLPSFKKLFLSVKNPVIKYLTGFLTTAGIKIII